jgi:hypothetical protein
VRDSSAFLVVKLLILDSRQYILHFRRRITFHFLSSNTKFIHASLDLHNLLLKTKFPEKKLWPIRSSFPSKIIDDKLNVTNRKMVIRTTTFAFVVIFRTNSQQRRFRWIFSSVLPMCSEKHRKDKLAVGAFYHNASISLDRRQR